MAESHLNSSNSVATRQCSSELGTALAAPSFVPGAGERVNENENKNKNKWQMIRSSVLE